jgi:eukaryotic-like serine/threonine-protein kinase
MCAQRAGSRAAFDIVPSSVSSANHPAASSPWSSEEGREFLQERICWFARFVLLLSMVAFVVYWFLGLVWDPASLEHGWPIGPTSLFHMAGMTVLLTMWLITRGDPLPAPVLQVIDAVGTCLVAAAMTARGAIRPLWLLMTVLPLFTLLIYRSAVVPSEPRRTARIGVVAVAALPIMTYVRFSRAREPLLPSAWAYAAYALLFAVLAVVLSTKVSRTIYGLRETVREARRLGPYTLVSKIGEGGMGAVYRAQHALLKRPTAIKILPPERASQIDLARFEREVQMTSQLTSPHTISIYDFGRTPDGLFYYAMEYIDGIDLDELLRRDGPMPPGRIVRVLRQVCDALAEAHRAGLIHRDVKPANILLSERGGQPDFAKVVDFGLVKSVGGGAAGITSENVVLGTPYYMAPETLQTPDRVDARSDLYSLAATAYHLLTGLPVFDGSTADVFAQLLRDPPVPPSKRAGRAVPESLERLILSALAKNPEDRPESVAAFAAGLAACTDVEPWSDAEAAAWWRRHRASREEGGNPEARSAGLAGQGTMRIDQARRRAGEPAA